MKPMHEKQFKKPISQHIKMNKPTHKSGLQTEEILHPRNGFEFVWMGRTFMSE